jgi:hypothetical protein
MISSIVLKDVCTLWTIIIVEAITAGFLEHQNNVAAVRESTLSILLLWLGSQYCDSICFSSKYCSLVWDSRQMKCFNIQPKIATIFLIHLINSVESSDRVSWLLKMECNHFRHERSLLNFQRNAVFNTLNEQSKSDFNCTLISVLKALLYALQCKFWQH